MTTVRMIEVKFTDEGKIYVFSDDPITGEPKGVEVNEIRLGDDLFKTESNSSHYDFARELNKALGVRERLVGTTFVDDNGQRDHKGGVPASSVWYNVRVWNLDIVSKILRITPTYSISVPGFFTDGIAVLCRDFGPDKSHHIRQAILVRGSYEGKAWTLHETTLRKYHSDFLRDGTKIPEDSPLNKCCRIEYVCKMGGGFIEIIALKGEFVEVNGRTAFVVK